MNKEDFMAENKAPRNRTVTLTNEEKEYYSKKILKEDSLNNYVDFDSIIHGDIYNCCKYIPPESVDLLFLDPPYNLSKRFHDNNFNKITEEKYAEWFNSWFELLLPSLKDTATVYVCGDDTHGTPIEVNAAKNNKTPEEFVKIWHDRHSKDMKTYLIMQDSYYTTGSKENKHFTELIYKRLKKSGHIYKKEIELMYDPKEKRFLPDRFIKSFCPKCGAVSNSPALQSGRGDR